MKTMRTFGPGLSARGRTLIARCALMLVSLVLVSLVGDRLAGQVTPAIPPPPVAHPANLTQIRESVEFSYEFKTNSMGLRYRDLPVRRQAGSDFRVVVSGDSFVEGWGVADDERFSSRLEGIFSTDRQPAYFINAGLSGAGPAEYGRALLTVGLRYQPDLALIVVYANDLYDTAVDAGLNVVRDPDGAFMVPPPSLLWPPDGIVRRAAYRLWPWTYARLQHVSREQERRNRPKRGFVEALRARARWAGVPDAEVDRWLPRVPAELLEAAENNLFDWRHLAAGLFDPDQFIESLDIQSSDAEARWGRFEAILGDVVSLVRVNNVPCGVVYAPEAVQYDESSDVLYRQTGLRVRREWLTEQSELERRLEAWARRADVPFLTLTDHLRAAAAARPGAYTFRHDGHWNSLGHELVAEVIADWLREQQLIRPAS